KYKNMQLENTRILITGGSSGLGKAMAEILRSAGARVLILGRDSEKVNRVADEI
ncbi:MAG TPA: short-chain dehydrogenase, partial [Cryomorphaceae bacterium]|nr:short-chain dehydrogenase [Cryomorphaceae bacterium]